MNGPIKNLSGQDIENLIELYRLDRWSVVCGTAQMLTILPTIGPCNSNSNSNSTSLRGTADILATDYLDADLRQAALRRIATRVGSITFKMYFNYKIQITFF